jgi:UDP-glucose 4-epimerase
MKILVTGGTGFIGSHTVVELAHAGYEPIIIDSLERSERSVLGGIERILGKSVQFYQGDCNNAADLAHIFETEKNIKGVIHFAAYKAVGESVQYPLMYYRNNVGATVTLIEQMIRFGIQDLVFSSSCTVYGQPEKLPVTEDAPIKAAESPYGNTKQICEEVIRDTVNAKAELRAISLRYFNPIGAHPSAEIGELPIGVPGNLVPFITQLAAGLREQLSVFGNDYNTPDGTCIRDYIHVVDLAKAHVKAIDLLQKQAEKQPFYDVINLGTGNGNSVLEVIKTFEAVNHVKLNWKFAPRRAGDVEKTYAAVEKSTRLLGWKTELTLEDALRDAWRWEKKIRKIK